MLGEELVAGMECRGLCDGIFEVGIAVGTQWTPPSCPRLVLVAEVRDSASCGRRLAPLCFVHGQAFKGAIEDGAGKSGARLRLDAALEAAEDGHVAGLQVRRASWRDEAQYDVWESGLHGGQGCLGGVDAGHVPEKDPRLSFFSWVHHVVQTGRELQDRGRRGPAVLQCDVASVLWPGLLRQDGVCLARVYDLHQHLQRATVHAESDRERRDLLCVALQLSLFQATAAPPDLLHREEPARRLVDVHDAVSADSMLVHQPAQLDEEARACWPLAEQGCGALSRTWRASCSSSAYHAGAAGPISGRASSPSASSHSSTRPLIVTALRHSTSVFRMMCSLSRVMSAGDSKVLLPSGAARGALRFQR